jgi:hypothetical protein
VRPLPDDLLGGPFTLDSARRLGVTDRMLEGGRFVRLFPRVYRLAQHEMTERDWVTAARLTLPADTYLTGITRIQQLGLDLGPRRPLRFVVERDLHVHLEGVFLHRTKRLPPHDAQDVTPAAAYLAYCARARVIDAIQVGSWLLRHLHVNVAELTALALAEPWRDGAHEALWMLDHLDPDARSIKESETLAVLTFAGLPRPEVNRALGAVSDALLIGDLWYEQWGIVVEYDGRQHQLDRAQYNLDIERYALLRRAGVRYVQVTSEKLQHPRTLVGEVFRELLAAGYDGPVPEFGETWRVLFSRVREVVGPRDPRTDGRAVA